MTAQHTLTDFSSIHPDFLTVKKFVYDACAFHLSDFQPEKESTEYAACRFQLNGRNIRYRAAKITPTKTGQFVTIWKRNANGETEPLHHSDDFDLVVITTRDGDHLGQFVFPTAVLLQRGIISGENKNGKRGIRVYPPWDEPTNKQAATTQNWQTNYFLPINNDGSTDLTKAKKLFDSY